MTGPAACGWCSRRTAPTRTDGWLTGALVELMFGLGLFLV
jgi:hypothetical protein